MIHTSDLSLPTQVLEKPEPGNTTNHGDCLGGKGQWCWKKERPIVVKMVESWHFGKGIKHGSRGGLASWELGGHNDKCYYPRKAVEIDLVSFPFLKTSSDLGSLPSAKLQIHDQFRLVCLGGSLTDSTRVPSTLTFFFSRKRPCSVRFFFFSCQSWTTFRTVFF